MIRFYTFFFLLISLSLAAQDFYNLNTIQKIELTFAESNWDQLLDNAYASTGDYILAESVAVNGVIMDSVGVKYKGNSTYNSNQTKNPFHIELDTYKDHKYEAYTDIKLSNVAKDPSFLREVLSYQILRQYTDASLSNYANVYVNGTYLGLYTNTESVSKKFVNNRFGSKNHTFIKCNPPEGAGPQTNDFPDLVYLGKDSTDYYDGYELKSDYGWSDLIDFCDTLKNNIAVIESVLDVDRALWMHAFNNVTVNLDSYSGAFTQNYYLYQDDYGRFLPILWDFNESFGRFSMSGSSNLNSTTAKQQMDHLLHANDADFPLISQLLANPSYKRKYLAHIKTIVLENFDNEVYIDQAEILRSLIDADVQADPNKLFTYNNFVENLYSDVNGGGGGPGGGGGAAPGISNLMQGRVSYLLGQSEFSSAEPTIDNLLLSNNTPNVGETIMVTAEIANANTAYLGYRNIKGAHFEKLDMFDDGLHGDSAAGDGIYGIDLNITNTQVQYYIYAENNDIGKFSPVRAEYEYHNIAASISNPTIGDLVINELMASNDITEADQDGEFDDWIELYNNGFDAIDLDGYFLSDDEEDLTQWTFPAGTQIDGDGYLIIWADSDEEQVGLHANFKLSASAESLYLLDPNGVLVDEVSFADQKTDVSYGRFPNGIGQFQLMVSTFNMENVGTSNSDDLILNEGKLSLYPNPASDGFTINITDQSQQELISIYDLNGKLIFRDTVFSTAWINTEKWDSGLYIVRSQNELIKLVVD